MFRSDKVVNILRSGANYQKHHCKMVRSRRHCVLTNLCLRKTMWDYREFSIGNVLIIIIIFIYIRHSVTTL